MPLIKSTFSGSPYLFNGHLETIVPALFRNSKTDYVRERITLGDGDFIDLDWIKQDQKKLIILLHGLEGSTGSQYMKGFANYFSERGFDICAVNFRSCSGEMNRLLRSYHSGASDDLGEVMSFISRGNIYEDIILIGFSMGGNILLKYLGENADRLPPALKGAVAFSVPVDLASSATELAKFMNKPYMARFLKTLCAKIKYKASQFPGKLDLTAIDRIRDFYEFDDRYTAPIHGFKGASDYYSRSSSKQFLGTIRIPTLLVNSMNDPFLAPDCYPEEIARESYSLTLEMPAKGGHVGFSLGFANGLYWSERRAFEFVQQILFL